MRILLIDVNCKSSSTGQIVYNLYSHINSCGDKAAICFGRGKQINEQNIIKFGLDWETYLHALLTRITGYTGCFSFFSTRRLKKYISSFKPDVVHIHELHAYFVNIKSLLNFLAKKDIKVVHTLHCEFSYTGKCGHSVNCEKWKKECGHCPNLKDYPTTLFFDHTKRMQLSKKKSFSQIKNLYIYTPSVWLANRAKFSFFSSRPISVIFNGIDTTIFKVSNENTIKRENGITNKEKIVLALAPNLMSIEKGGPFVIKLAKQAENKNIRFIMIGVSGIDRKEVDNVIMLGPIYDKKLLAQYYSISDAFIICSLRENFPTTCLEAQCCGTPVFGFDTGGSKETDVSGMNLFSEYGDMEKLYSNLNKVLYTEIVSRNDLSMKAIQKYSSNTMCRKYYDEYKKILNK